MKGILAFLLDLGRRTLHPANHTFHDDSLRANQGGPNPGFSYWRALVS